MLEYVFFHEILAKQFVDIAKSYNIESQLIAEELGWEVHLPEDIDELIELQISDYYDDLFEQDQDMYEQSQYDSDNEYQTAAIEITLSNGDKTYAETNQAIMGKLMSTLSFDELNQLVQNIVNAVENPDSRTICEKHRDENHKTSVLR